MQLRNGTSVEDHRLDRLPSATTEHLDKYPFRARMLGTEILPKPTPVVIGVNWYSVFDRPVQGRDRRWRVASNGKVGFLRGGHCVCLPPLGVEDAATWWSYYNQGEEGRCVQFGTSRALSLMNRVRYSVAETDIGRWLYWQAQREDEWEGGDYPGASPLYGGTSVRAALDIVQREGIIRERASTPSAADGISAYRWAATMDDVLAALGRSTSEIPWLNSWGTNYPRVVWVPVEVHARLLDEQGEYGLVTDK